MCSSDLAVLQGSTAERAGPYAQALRDLTAEQPVLLLRYVDPSHAVTSIRRVPVSGAALHDVSVDMIRKSDTSSAGSAAASDLSSLHASPPPAMRPCDAALAVPSEECSTPERQPSWRGNPEFSPQLGAASQACTHHARLQTPLRRCRRRCCACRATPCTATRCNQRLSLAHLCPCNLDSNARSL